MFAELRVIPNRYSLRLVLIFTPSVLASFRLWKGGRKGTDRSRWLNSPNVYQKVEILETGTPDPKKITKVEVITFENKNE